MWPDRRSMYRLRYDLKPKVYRAMKQDNPGSNSEFSNSFVVTFDLNLLRPHWFLYMTYIAHGILTQLSGAA